MMKKILYSLIFASAVVLSANLQAQDCEEIVLPHVGYNRAKLELMPKEKVQWYCTYSKSSFFLTNDIPAGSVVMDIRDVVYKRTGEHLKADFVVDLTTLSYFAYNFEEFQYQNYNKTIYFHTPNSTYKYLGLYTKEDTYKRAEVNVKQNE